MNETTTVVVELPEVSEVDALKDKVARTTAMIEYESAGVRQVQFLTTLSAMTGGLGGETHAIVDELFDAFTKVLDAIQAELDK